MEIGGYSLADGTIANASVDGTDCRIREPSPFSSKWYSHKFNGPGLRYEVGISVAKGDIVWVHGPFPCRSYPDIKIFRLRMKHRLPFNEVVVADVGYNDEKCMSKQDCEANKEELHSTIRARHESANGRLKNFAVLQSKFRHKLSLHSICFHAVANVVQITIESGHPLFKIIET